MIAKTPTPPYYAVIFTSVLSEKTTGYEEMARQMVELAALQPGFLGVESAREGLGITVSYWDSLEAIGQWKNNAAHLVARQKGRSHWYAFFKTRIALVEKDYEFEK